MDIKLLNTVLSGNFIDTDGKCIEPEIPIDVIGF